jgi:Rrf2 family nitric oxide-sensitive transcriptional repressor
MQLTRFTDYALRALLYVGRQRGRVCTMSEIAAYYRISPEHMRKVTHRMARCGYLDARRGRGGGVVLRDDPGRIRIGDVVMAMEEDMTLVDCEAIDCMLSPHCSLKAALDHAGRAFIAALNEVTLADLLGNAAMERQFRRIDAVMLTRRAR